MTNIRNFLHHTPEIAKTAYVDNSAVIIGRVKIGENSSVWCNAVARGDVAEIIIGKNSNIQDLTMLHVTHENPGRTTETPLIIGDYVTIGHHCCLHACTLKNNILVGMSSTILDNVVIDDNVMIGAGSLVPPGKHLESGYLYLGNPVKQVRKLTDGEIKFLQYSATHYVKVADQHKQSQ